MDRRRLVMLAAALAVSSSLGTAPGAHATRTAQQCSPGYYYSDYRDRCIRAYRVGGAPGGNAPCQGGQFQKRANDKRWGWYPYDQNFLIWWSYEYVCHYTAQDRWDYWVYMTACETSVGCNAGWFLSDSWCRSGNYYRRCGSSSASDSLDTEDEVLSPMLVYPPWQGMRQLLYPSAHCYEAETTVYDDRPLPQTSTNVCAALQPADDVVDAIQEVLGIRVAPGEPH